MRSIGLSIYSLLEELKKELEEELKTLYFEDEKGERVSMNIYKQDLPVETYDDTFSPFHYTVIRIVSGSSPINYKSNDGEAVRILILIGVIDKNIEKRPQESLIGVIERVKQKFMKKPHLKHFSLTGDITWGISEEDKWPYSFGGLDLKFKIMPINIEESLI